MPTKIEWAEETWNPVVGCTPCSRGCDHCYAVRWARRLKARGIEKYQTVVDQAGWTGEVAFSEKELYKPLRRRIPTVYFVCSMGDLFHPRVDVEFLERIMGVITARTLITRHGARCDYQEAPKHRYVVLTKRPAAMELFVMPDGGSRWHAEPVFWGASWVYGDHIAKLHPVRRLAEQGHRTVVSFEPLIGPVPLAMISPLCSQVIVGGEKGPGARPMHPDWARNIRDQCQKLNIPFFFKQWGSAAKRKDRLLDGREWNELAWAAWRPDGRGEEQSDD
ncbi:MAG: DUF5131 family protein [Thermoleophilia bacterium]|nr:DUF5131 family protein [Thermoleophilia bacterium]